MLRGLRDDKGLTLTELMVVTMLLGFILAAAWSVMYAANTMSNKTTARADAADESQKFIDRIGYELIGSAGQFDIVQAYNEADGYTSGYSDTNDVRAALAPSWVSTPVASTSLTFYTDLNRDDRPERIRYYVSNGSLMRVQASAATTNPLPCTWGANSTPTVIIKKIDPSWTGPIFVPLTGDDIPPTAVTNSAAPNDATAVQVQMRNIRTSGDQSSTYNSATTVRIRNKSGFG
jgi:prepilin-type N-terminal cleavage/methylation domain-containing protein